MIVVRLLSAHDYGVLAIVRTTIAFVAALAGFGMGSVLVRYLPERETLQRGSRQLFRLCGATQAAGWLVFLIVVILLRRPIDALYGSPVGTPLMAGAAFLSGNMAFTLLQCVYTATFRTRTLAMLQTLLSVAILLLSWAALSLGWGVIGVLGAASLPYLAISLVAAPQVFRSLKGGRAPREGARLFRYAIPFAAVEILNLITWRQSETLMLGHFTGPEAAGTFDIAYRLPQLLMEFIPEAIWPLVLAAFAEIYTRRKEKLGELIAHYFRLLFVLITPVTLFGALYGDILIEALYGVERAAAGDYARIFFVIFHVSFFGTPFSMAIYILEKTWVNLVLSLIFALVNVGLDLVLIPRYGLAGAIPPVALAVLLSPILRAIALRKLYGSVPVPWLFLGKCYLASASLLLLFPIRVAGGPWVSLPLLGGAALLVVPLSFRLVRIIGAEERQLLQSSSLPGKEIILKWFG